MTITISLQVNPRALPEGMTEDDLAELVTVPFRKAAMATFTGMRDGTARDALALASVSILFHEALNYIGVDPVAISSWNAWRDPKSAGEVSLAVTWGGRVGGPVVSLSVDVP